MGRTGGRDTGTTGIEASKFIPCNRPKIASCASHIHTSLTQQSSADRNVHILGCLNHGWWCCSLPESSSGRREIRSRICYGQGQTGTPEKRETREKLDLKLNSVRVYTNIKVALRYICNETKHFYTYVHNSVQRIRQSSTLEQWHYVRTDENPADHALRSLPSSHLGLSCWFTGPSFLCKRPHKPVRSLSSLNLKMMGLIMGFVQEFWAYQIIAIASQKSAWHVHCAVGKASTQIWTAPSFTTGDGSHLCLCLFAL